MRRLILMRHAKAERESDTGRDRDRPLAASGLADARRMGRALAGRGWAPDTALVSSATRTRQTWEAASEAFGDVELDLEDRLYNAEPDVIRRMIEDAEDRAGCLMVVAHNPGVHLLAVDYLTESAASPAVIDRLSGGFPTGSAVLFGVDPAGRCVYEGWLTPAALGGEGE